MRSNLNKLLTQKTLSAINNVTGSNLLDMIEDNFPDTLQLKNLCAKISPALNARVEEVCGTLSITKRTFIEACLIEGLYQAEKILEEEGFYQSLESIENQVAA